LSADLLGRCSRHLPGSTVAPWGRIVKARIAQPGVETVISDLTRLECRGKPIGDQDEALLADFDRYFQEDVIETVQLSPAAVNRATEIRAAHRFGTPHARHLGAALASWCDAFLTNDHRLNGFPDIELEVVENL